MKTNIAFWQRQSWKNDTKYHMLELKIGCIYNSSIHQKMPLRENSPNTEFFLVLGIRIGWNWIFLTKYRNFDGLQNTLWTLALFFLMYYQKCSFPGSENNSDLDTFLEFKEKRQQFKPYLKYIISEAFREYSYLQG